MQSGERTKLAMRWVDGGNTKGESRTDDTHNELFSLVVETGH